MWAWNQTRYPDQIFCAVMNTIPIPACGFLVAILVAGSVAAQTKSELDAAKAAIELKMLQASADTLLKQREAEARQAIAEAERAELLARLPPAWSKPLTGEIAVSKFGAAGLVKAFDLARDIAAEVCSALPADRRTVIHDPASTQGVVTARIVHDGIAHMNNSLTQQAKDLQVIIDTHTPAGSKRTSVSLVGLAAIPAVVKSVADVAALFKTDVRAEGIAYGDGARELFATALAQSCPDRITALGTGYLGELDPVQHDQLVGRVRALVVLRGENANRVAQVEQLAAAAKGDLKRELTRAADRAGDLLKAVDAFVESLKVGEASDKSPLYNAARYMGYASRVRGAPVLDFDLRLEGLTVVKDGLFTGQQLRLAGVAFLTYRLHETDGRLLFARAVRRITQPVRVNLRGVDGSDTFWNDR